MKKQKIIIIGAGSTGLSTALELARTKEHREFEIIVLEKEYVGSGQTNKSCGFVRTFYNAPQMITSAKFSMQAIKKICKNEPSLQFVQTGLLVLDKIDRRESIKSNVALMRSLGVNVSYLEESKIKTIHPYLNTDKTCAGFDVEAGYVEPQLIVNYLEKECKKLGVKIFEQTKVIDIAITDGQFNIITSNGSLIADKLFNATAGYTNSINKMFGFHLPVKTISVNNTFYRLPLTLNNYHVAMADFVNGFYAIPRENFIDVSALTLDLGRSVDVEQGMTTFDPYTMQEFLDLLSKRMIGAERATSIGGFGSYIDVTPDYYPIISAIDEIPNYYCAAGFSGTGFKHFPMIGILMRDLILEQTPIYPDLISFLRYDRFKQENIRHEVSDSYFINEASSVL